MQWASFPPGLFFCFVLCGFVTAAVAESTNVFNGIRAGKTTWDWQQYSSARQIETAIDSEMGTGKRFVHVCWTMLESDDSGDPSRNVYYNCYDWTSSSWTVNLHPDGGMPLVEEGERGGFGALGVYRGGNAAVFHCSQVEDDIAYGRVSRFAIPSMGVKTDDRLDNLPGEENIALRGAGTHDTLHVVGRDGLPEIGDPAHLVYWRFKPVEPFWEGPVLMDSSMVISHQVVVRGSRVVLAFAKPCYYGVGRNLYNNDLAYYESTVGGEDWIASGGPPTSWENGGGFNVTDYADTDPHRCYVDVSGGFDSAGRLHLLYTNPCYFFECLAGPCDLLHWSEGTPGSNENAVASGGPPGGFIGGQDQYFHTVASAQWGWDGVGNDGSNGTGNRNISRPLLAFGDGSTLCHDWAHPNLDYLYVVYTQFGSPDPVDKADVSNAGYMNGNIWLSISGDGGATWSPQRCLTTIDGTVGGIPTRSPGCDVEAGDTCLSEHWPSVASVVNDTLHVFYLGDTEAGSAVMGEGAWSLSPMIYRPVIGALDGALCPNMCDCGIWGDLNLDGLVNPVDVVASINCVFKCGCDCGLTWPRPDCPWRVGDVNCDGMVSPLDVVYWVWHVYKSKPWVLENCSDADNDPATNDDIGCQ